MGFRGDQGEGILEMISDPAHKTMFVSSLRLPQSLRDFARRTKVIEHYDCVGLTICREGGRSNVSVLCA